MRPEPVPQPVEALHRAVHAGDDTDMVAAIAGSLLGARLGAGAIPAEWRALRARLARLVCGRRTPLGYRQRR